MTISDAKGILGGGDTAGTEYFRRTTRAPLHGRFLPIVKRATAKGRTRHKYNEYAGKASRSLVGKQDANLDEYVTQKALERPLLHGRRGGEENPQGSGAGRQRHHQEGFRRSA